MPEIAYFCSVADLQAFEIAHKHGLFGKILEKVIEFKLCCCNVLEKLDTNNSCLWQIF